MSLLVLDASVAILWAIPAQGDRLAIRADRVLRRHLEREIDFVVPDIFWAEVVNTLCKGVRQGRWDRNLAVDAASDLSSFNFETVPSRWLLPEAQPIALNFSISVYDCVYVALAMAAQSDLITADERLANALAARFPVKWLGAL